MEFSSLVNLRLVDFFFNSFYFLRNSQKDTPTILENYLDKYLVCFWLGQTMNQRRYTENVMRSVERMNKFHSMCVCHPH